MNFKVLKSDEDSVWLFNATVVEDAINAGLACFTPHCPSEVRINIENTRRIAIVPSKAMGSVVPIRILEARLSLLPLTNNE